MIYMGWINTFIENLCAHTILKQSVLTQSFNGTCSGNVPGALLRNFINTNNTVYQYCNMTFLFVMNVLNKVTCSE